MKGILYKSNNWWAIKHTFTPYDDYVVYNREYMVNPYDRTEKMVGKEVEFDVESFWETGMEEVIEIAIIKNV